MMNFKIFKTNKHTELTKMEFQILNSNTKQCYSSHHIMFSHTTHTHTHKHRNGDEN